MFIELFPLKLVETEVRLVPRQEIFLYFLVLSSIADYFSENQFSKKVPPPAKISKFGFPLLKFPHPAFSKSGFPPCLTYFPNFVPTDLRGGGHYAI